MSNRRNFSVINSDTISKNYFKDRFYKELLSDANWKTINKLALLLALAESLDYTETSQIHVIEPGINKKTATLKLYAQGIPSIEMHQIQEHLSWFKKTFAYKVDRNTRITYTYIVEEVCLI